MEATKKLNGKAVGKWLSNNAIIMMMLAITLIVGIIHPNFFSGTNMINLFKNVSIRYIIALGISGCLTFMYGSAKSTDSARSSVTVKFASIISTLPVFKYSTLLAASVETNSNLTPKSFAILFAK